MGKRKMILSHTRSPGDIMCLTALVRDIHLNYPGKFEIDYHTSVQDIWHNNPYLTKLWDHKGNNPKGTMSRDTEFIKCCYKKGLSEQNREVIHFCAYFHRDFEEKTGIPVPPRYPHGDLHLSEAEKNISPVEGKYWLLITGGKSDYPIKVWYSKYFQEVSDWLGSQGLGVVQTGATHKGHWHPKLKGEHVIDLVGWGRFREFLMQIQHAEGVICGVTAAMHIAAALHKPCVVIGGGREAPCWEGYYAENKGFGELCAPHPVPHRYLHTMGLLDCCSERPCWRNKVVKIDSDNWLCKRPVINEEMPVAECMMMIKPDHVINAISSYYLDGTLTPPHGMFSHET